MSAEKTSAIVLRVIPFSETSCIVTMMTQDFGKLTFMAKGARRPKSPFEAALDVLAICRIVFLHKTNGTMSLLTEAKLDRRFRSSSTNLKRLYAGYYIIELLNILTDDGDPQRELYELASAAIESIDSPAITVENLNLTLLRFEFRTLELLGHFPMLTKCVSCGKEKTTIERVSFGLNSGGVLCEICRRGQVDVISLSKQAFATLLVLAGGQIGRREANSDNWSPRTRQQAKDREQQRTFFSTTPQPPSPTSEQPTTKTALVGSEPKIQSSTSIAEPTSNVAVNLVTNAINNANQTGQSTSAEPQFQAPELLGLNELRMLVNKYIAHLIGFPPKLHKFLKDI